jgi:ribonuclease D
MKKALPLYIQTQAELESAVDSFAALHEIALDLEFDRERYTYGSTICLIQVFAAGKCFMVDPMACRPEPLYRLLERPDLLKIMHSPGEDLQILHLQGCYPVNVFDTERAARLLNYEAFSLSSLLQLLLGVSLDKSVQKTNWTQRPLTAAQLTYACSDVAWLPALRDALWEQAIKSNICDWIEEENKAWDIYRAEPRPDGVFTHRDDSKKYPAYDLFLLNELLRFRDMHSRRLNKPGYMVISRELIDKLLTEPDTLTDWKHQKGIHQSLRNDQTRRAIESLLEKARATAREQALSKKFPARQKPDGVFRSREEIKQEAELIFRPLKQEMALKWGEHAAAYMLSEKMITELCSRSKKLADLPFQYRIKLLLEIAGEKQINLSAYQ